MIMHKLWKKTRAISPIIGTLLLVVIVVISGVALYAFITGWLGSTGVGMPQIDLASADSDSGNIRLYVRNAGVDSITINKIYVQGVAVTNSTTSPAVWTPTIPAETVVFLSITGQTLTAGQTYTVKVVFADGSQVSTSIIASSSSGTPSTSTPALPTPTATPAPTATPVPGLPVTIRFATNLTHVDGQGIVIDGVSHKWVDYLTFNWVSGDTHTIEALSPAYTWDTPSKGFVFYNWTNGNGLVDASGTFTVPDESVTVTANYVQSTVYVSFATSGLSNLNSGVTVLTIDGVNYDYWDVINAKFSWDTGSTHTVVAASPIKGWDNVVNHFSSWTNGNGLTKTTTTFTVPATDVTVTANYSRNPSG
jgi:flagellin-like protein